MLKRSITKIIENFLLSKLVLVNGPRQVGKTYLARHLLPGGHFYLNFDDEDDRRIIKEKSWPRKENLIIFDELHKMPFWKRWIKALYDKEGIPPQILITGSAKMDVFKKGGDSLAGRHFHVRLHPFSIKELNQGPSKDMVKRMMICGAFPEPYLKGEETFSKLWRKHHLDRIIREDLLDLERVRELKKIELLVDSLSERVGNLVNFSSLGRDLEVSSATIKHWLQILEDLYVIFKVPPFTHKTARTLLKASKYYFYDTGRVRHHLGAQIENLVACHLQKRVHYLEDSLGEKGALYFVRDEAKRETDFAIVREKSLEYLIEVKAKEETLSSSLRYFTERFAPKHSLQLVFDLKREKQYGLIQITDLTSFLWSLEI